MNSSWLQMHVIGWTGFAMRLFHIYIRNLGVVAHHIQRTMSQQRLQSEHIAPRTQVGDCKSVPEFMRVDFLDICSGTQPVDQHTQAVLVERPVSVANEERRAWIVPVFTACQVTPDGFSGGLAQVNGAPLTALGATGDAMPDDDLSSLEVNIIDRQRAEFGCAQSGIQQHQNNRLIAIGARPAHDKLLSVLSLGFPSEDTCLQNLFEVFLGKSLDGMLLKFGSLDFSRRIGKRKLHVQPAEKGTERHPHIANGLGGHWLSTTVEAHWLVLGTQPGHVIGEVGSLNFGNAPITNVLQPMVERVFVGVDCALA